MPTGSDSRVERSGHVNKDGRATSANLQVNALAEGSKLARSGCRTHAVIRHYQCATQFPRGFFETAGHIDDVPHDRELDASLGTDVADDYRTEMDPDGDGQPAGASRAPLAIPSLDLGQQ